MVNATASSKSTNAANGIYASNAVAITGGTVTTTATSTSYTAYGIRTFGGDVVISGSDTEVNATASGTSGTGINANSGAITISGGTVNAEATATSNWAYAIYATGIDGISISDGTVNAEATSTSSYAEAIYANRGDVTISGGTVNAEATSTYSDAIGIEANADVTISGTADVTAKAIGSGSYDYAIYAYSTLSVAETFIAKGYGTDAYDVAVEIHNTSKYYIETDGGAIVTNIHIIDDNAVPSTSTGSVKKYSNTLDVDDNGSAYAIPLVASSGTTVYITVSPDTGYEVDEVLVDDGNITVTNKGDGSYSYKQPAYAVDIKVTFVATDEVEEVVEDLNDFEDVVAGAWYEEFVVAAVEAGIMQGISSTEFAPDGTTTRATMVKVLYNIEDEPVVDYLMTFTDVNADLWYGEAVRWASSQGVVLGVNDTEFAPNQELTREQLVTMLYRYAMATGEDTSAVGDLTTYNDYETISDWAVEAFAWAVAEGIINGGNGNLNPHSSATRAELAKIMACYLDI